MNVRLPDDIYAPGEGPEPNTGPTPVESVPVNPESAAPRMLTLQEIVDDTDLDEDFKRHQKIHDYRLPESLKRRLLRLLWMLLTLLIASLWLLAQT